jgi:hypothetical protein
LKFADQSPPVVAGAAVSSVAAVVSAVAVVSAGAVVSAVASAAAVVSSLLESLSSPQATRPTPRAIVAARGNHFLLKRLLKFSSPEVADASFR